jgi:surfeit locus 1 family protein
MSGSPTVAGKGRTRKRAGVEGAGAGVRRVSWRGVAAAAAALLVAVVCIRLGFWQLDRLEQRRTFNAEQEAALEQPPLELDAATIRAIREDPGAFRLRRAVARGSFLEANEVLLRGRAHQGRPGVHVVSPLVLGGQGDLLLVNRGWLPSPDAATADPRPYAVPGAHVIEGILRDVPRAPEEAAPISIEMGDARVSSFRRLDYATLSDVLPGALLPLYLEEATVRSGLPYPVPPPVLDEGPHLGYALQWFAFAAIAIVGFGVTVTVGRGRAL